MSKKKKFVSYSNCQGWGVAQFLFRSSLHKDWEISHYNNYQIILKEQSAVDLFREAAECDCFFYQPTPAIQYCELSTEVICEEIVSKDALKLSFGYGFNHGFYPLVHHGQWQTSEEVKQIAIEDPKIALEWYDCGKMFFDCQKRFEECLAEQRRREEKDSMELRMVDWMLENYKRKQLFICENHPASAYLAELAHRLIKIITGRDELVPYSGNNDAYLPCGLLVHPAVVNELQLEYAPEPGAQAFFRQKLVDMIEKKY